MACAPYRGARQLGNVDAASGHDKVDTGSTPAAHNYSSRGELARPPQFVEVEGVHMEE